MQVEVKSPVEDEVKKWIPNPKQTKFISLPFSIFEAFFGGEKGPGKTEILVLLPILYGFHNNPNYRGLYMRRNFTDIEREVTDRQRKYYPSTGAVYNEQKHRWKWPNGAVDRQGHAEHEQSVRAYDTDEYHLLRWDELTHFSYFQYQYLSFTRVRSSDPFLPAIIRSSGNPGNIGHKWVFDRFIKPGLGGFKRIRQRIIDPLTKQYAYKERMFIPASLSDNPYINAEYRLGLQLLSEAERRAAFGDWNAFAGQVFSEFRIMPFGDEPENAQHVIDSFPIPNWWPKVIAIDWGWDANTCIGWGAIAPNGRLYIYRIYNEPNKYIAEWIRDLINLSGSELDSVRKIKICHSARQQRGETKTIEQQVSEAFLSQGVTTPVELGKKDRIGGKMLVHEFLRWKTIPHKILQQNFDQELADKINRIHGPEEYDKYMKFFQPENPELLPRVQLFDKECQPLIDVIPSCVYEQKENKNSEDVAEFKGDDPYDMFRMLLESVDEYVRDASVEFQQRQTIDEILKRYNQTNDTTSFYRAMERVENNGPIHKPIRLFHRSRRLRLH